MDMDGSGDHWLADHPPQFPQPQDVVGDWVDYLLGFGNPSSAATKDDSSSSSTSWVNNNHVQQADADPLSLSLWGMCYDLQQPVPLVGASSSGQSPVGAADLQQATIIRLLGFDDNSLEDQPAANVLTTTTEEPDDEMVRTVSVWSEDEHKELLHRLHMYAEDDAVTRCFKIACHLPNKTALDVALRCRWLQLQNKMKTAEVAQKDDTAHGKLVKKVKRTKIARKSNNKIYPLSKEALNSKSIKQLIQDNNMFLKRIEDNLKTGQLANTADYFHYVKTNLDAIKERPSEFGIKMDMPPIDEQGLEEILRARLNSLALIEDQTPKAP